MLLRLKFRERILKYVRLCSVKLCILVNISTSLHPVATCLTNLHLHNHCIILHFPQTSLNMSECGFKQTASSPCIPNNKTFKVVYFNNRGFHLTIVPVLKQQYIMCLSLSDMSLSAVQKLTVFHNNAFMANLWSR